MKVVSSSGELVLNSGKVRCSMRSPFPGAAACDCVTGVVLDEGGSGVEVAAHGVATAVLAHPGVLRLAALHGHRAARVEAAAARDAQRAGNFALEHHAFLAGLGVHI